MQSKIGILTSTNMYSTSDLTNWSTLNSLGSVKEVIYGNKYVALLANSIIYTSTDGITYTNANSNLSTIISNAGGRNNMCYYNNKYFTCGYKVTSCVAYSTDGITWIASNLTGEGLMDSIIYTGSVFIASGMGFLYKSVDV